MLGERDILVLPQGVKLDEGQIVDDVRGMTVTANPAAIVVLTGVGVPLDATIALFARRWQLGRDHARRDVLRFAWQLNRLGLVNVCHADPRRTRITSWVRLAIRTIPYGRLPEPRVRRHAIDTSTRARALLTTSRVLAGRVVGLALGAAVVVAGTDAATGGGDAVGALVVGGTTGLAILVHELGHVLALGRAPAAILLVGGRASVVHPPRTAMRAFGVALAGPLAAVLLGVALSALALAEQSPAIALAACPAVGHALAATVAARDGRTVCGLPGRSRTVRTA